MALTFPANPTNGQYYNGFVYNSANSSWDSAFNPSTNAMLQVSKYASAAARTTAIPAPAEGMITYLDDVDQFQGFSGTAWKGLGTIGQIVQIVTATYTTQTSNTTTSWIDTGLTATITPKSSTSTILVLVTQPIYIQRSSTYSIGGIKLLRDSTGLDDTSSSLQFGMYANGSGAIDIRQIANRVYVDTPASTSALTYKTQFVLNESGAGASIMVQEASKVSRIVLIEVTA